MSHTVVRELIDKMGGRQAVAEMARVQPGSVSKWQAKFGAFPPDTYLLIHEELRRRGYLGNDEELPASLWGMKVRRPAKRGPRGSQ